MSTWLFNFVDMELPIFFILHKNQKTGKKYAIFLFSIDDILIFFAKSYIVLPYNKMS